MKNFFRKLSILICVLILELSATALLFLIPLHHSVSKNSIKDYIMNYKDKEEGGALKDMMETHLTPLYKESEALEIEDDVIYQIIETDEMRELVADVTSDMIDYILTGEEKESLTEEDLKKVTILAIDKINEETEYNITERQKQEILDALHNNTGAYLDSLPKIDTLEQSLSSEEKEALHIIRFLFSTKLKIGLFILMILSMLGIILLKWKEKKWIKTIATTLLISSIFILLGMLLFQGINRIVFKEEAFYVFELFQKMIHQSFLLAGSVAISMIIILIAYKVLKEKQKERTVNIV